MDMVSFTQGILESILYSLLGIGIMALCFILIEKVTLFSVKKELIEDENVALGIMFAGFFIAVAIIIAAAIK